MKEGAEMLMNNTKQKDGFFSTGFSCKWCQNTEGGLLSVFLAARHSPRTPAPPVPGPGSVPPARAGLCLSTDSKNTQNNQREDSGEIEQLKSRGASSLCSQRCHAWPCRGQGSPRAAIRS